MQGFEELQMKTPGRVSPLMALMFSKVRLRMVTNGLVGHFFTTGKANEQPVPSV